MDFYTSCQKYKKIERFVTFTEDNDPYREHDSGAIDHSRQKIYWKIDYYNPDMTHEGENPADPSKTPMFLPSCWQRSIELLHDIKNKVNSKRLLF
ncbi:MAG: hypothetical protein A3D13_04615 [Planctomycetes bacterium RIFCSPHIGHO2_02_FULL_40_12]|nr:MAG: hypothetical protein A3D13_04615 [Planctomycetes bacterium RIFCSPHIGHO2_02_FULL_40_12]OHC01435.1 MAG: hypothetical protein A3H23_07900 [Planctomycetes bacterium RIFCSPLOWO2_12_FULL_40_19]